MIQQLNGIIGGVSNLLWLCLAVYLLIYFRRQIGTLLDTVSKAQEGKFQAKAAGIEGSIEWKRSVAETAVNLTAAALRKAGGEQELPRIVNSVAAAAEAGLPGAAAGKNVLWVDDEPQNNVYGVKALEAQGINVMTSTSTPDALEQCKANDFVAIVTDQRRVENGVEDREAGNHLLEALRRMGLTTPVILSTAFPDKSEARRRGFFDATNTQHGVFELVMRAIAEGSSEAARRGVSASSKS